LFRIDAFSHVLPATYRKAVLDSVPDPSAILQLWGMVDSLTNIDERIAAMAETGVDMQVLTLATPPPEQMFEQKLVERLVPVANDSIAQLVVDHPDRFVGTCSVDLRDPERASAELDRSVTELGLQGVQLFSNIAGRPLDHPDFEEFYSEVERLGVPIWIHPYRPESHADYPTETESKYLIWYSLGWPMDTTIAMARLVFGGVLARHPRLRVIIHHAGALVPSLAHRLKTIYRAEWLAHSDFAPGVPRPYVDEFKQFYGDTVVTYGGSAALRRACDFFGLDHIVFGTDTPYGLREGREFNELAVSAVSGLGLTPEQADLIWHGNVLDLLPDGDRLRAKMAAVR